MFISNNSLYLPHPALNKLVWLHLLVLGNHHLNSVIDPHGKLGHFLCQNIFEKSHSFFKYICKCCIQNLYQEILEPLNTKLLTQPWHGITHENISISLSHQTKAPTNVDIADILSHISWNQTPYTITIVPNFQTIEKSWLCKISWWLQ